MSTQISPSAEGPGRWPNMDTQERDKVYGNLKEAFAGEFDLNPGDVAADLYEDISGPQRDYNMEFAANDEKLKGMPVSSTLFEAFKKGGMPEDRAKNLMFFSLDFLQGEQGINIDKVDANDKLVVYKEEGTDRWKIKAVNKDGVNGFDGYLFPEPPKKEDNEEVPAEEVPAEEVPAEEVPAEEVPAEEGVETNPISPELAAKEVWEKDDATGTGLLEEVTDPDNPEETIWVIKDPSKYEWVEADLTEDNWKVIPKEAVEETAVEEDAEVVEGGGELDNARNETIAKAEAQAELEGDAPVEEAPVEGGGELDKARNETIAKAEEQAELEGDAPVEEVPVEEAPVEEVVEEAPAVLDGGAALEAMGSQLGESMPSDAEIVASEEDGIFLYKVGDDTVRFKYKKVDTENPSASTIDLLDLDLQDQSLFTLEYARLDRL